MHFYQRRSYLIIDYDLTAIIGDHLNSRASDACNPYVNINVTSKNHKLRKTFGKFFRSYSELLSKFGEISFQDYVSQGIAHPVFYGDLVYKLRRVKGEANFISSGSKIVKRLRRRQYDPAIIERTIGLVLGPITALYRSFLKRCTLTNKAVGTIWRALSKPPQRRQGPNPRPLWLLVGTPSAFWTWARVQTVRSSAYCNGRH